MLKNKQPLERTPALTRHQAHSAQVGECGGFLFKEVADIFKGDADE